MSRETYIIRIAKSPWSNFYFAAVAAAPTAAAAAELWSFAAKNSFQTKAFKGQQIPLALLKRSLSRTMLYRRSNLPFGSQIFQSKTYEKYLGRWIDFSNTKKNRDDDRFHRVRGTSETEVKSKTHYFLIKLIKTKIYTLRILVSF